MCLYFRRSHTIDYSFSPSPGRQTELKCFRQKLSLNFLMAILIVVGWVMASPAFGAQKIFGEGLMVAPTKLTFEGRTRSGTTLILNKGEEKTTYRIALVPVLDIDTGQDAKEWVRFSPRRTTLAPGETQTVRIFVRKPPDLPAGEYTARLLVQAIPPSPKPRDAAGKDPDSKQGMSVNLDVVYGVTIPLHIKHNP